MKKVIILTYSLQGGSLAERLLEELQKSGYEAEGYLFAKYQRQGLFPFQEAEGIVERAFLNGSALIFISAAGIAVRKIAPYVKSKFSDSAVVVLDDSGRFAISLLSGHMGGANELTHLCAELIGAVPVITTATDVHHKFAVDNFARRNRLFFQDAQRAKEISAEVLAGNRVGFWTEEGVFIKEAFPEELTEQRDIYYGIMVTPFCRQDMFPGTLRLIPRQITLGIGCKKGIDRTVIENAIQQVLAEHQIERQALRQVCSIDLKAEEAGLRSFCRDWGLPFVTFSGEELLRIEGSVSSSAFVKQVTGVDNVCERSALAGIGGKGKLIMTKQALHGVTVAAALEEIELTFSR